MSENKKFWIALIVLIGSFIIPQIDETYITAHMKESGALLERQCQIDPKNCWLQKRAHK